MRFEVELWRVNGATKLGGKLGGKEEESEGRCQVEIVSSRGREGNSRERERKASERECERVEDAGGERVSIE